MPSRHILSKDDIGDNVQCLGIGATTTLTISDGTAQTTAIIDTSHETVVRCCFDLDVYLAIDIGATATSADAYLPANVVEYFKVDIGERISAIRKNADTGEGTLTKCT